MRQEHRLLAGLLTVAVLTLLYCAISRRPTRPVYRAETSQSSSPSPSPTPTRRDSTELLIDTELYKLSRVNASIRHNRVPLQISLLAAVPRRHIVAKMPSVLLLHGHDQSAMMWEKMGTLQVLAETGHRIYAIDLPGAGSTRLQGKLAHSEFLQAVIDYLDLDRPLMVAPSMSGVYAFEYVFEESDSIDQRLSGFIGLSPSHALAYRQEEFANFKKLYTVLIHGDDGDLSGQEAYKRFRLVPSVRVIPISTAGHLHYMERPDIVNDVIIDALKSLED